MTLEPNEPTNSDLYERLGSMEATFETKLTDILKQVQKTNGRVTKLERWKEKLDIIADFTKENPQTPGIPQIDWQKLMVYSLGLVGTALAIISYMAGKR